MSFHEADTKKTLNLKGFAQHLVKLDGQGTSYPTIKNEKGVLQTILEAVDGMQEGIKGVCVRFRPECSGDEGEKLRLLSYINSHETDTLLKFHIFRRALVVDASFLCTFAVCFLSKRIENGKNHCISQPKGWSR